MSLKCVKNLKYAYKECSLLCLVGILDCVFFAVAWLTRCPYLTTLLAIYANKLRQKAAICVAAPKYALHCTGVLLLYVQRC